MDNLGESPTDKGGESEESRATPGNPLAADTEETDRDGDAALKEAAAEEREIKSQDVSGLTAVEREDSFLTPAAKKLKLETKDKKEKKKKVDEAPGSILS